MMRQPLLFLLVGGMQYLLDASIFGLLLSGGLGITASNVLSRGSAAAMGFLANRYLTFNKQSDSIASFSGSLFRFVIMWLTFTAISTALMLAISMAWETDLTSQVISKLLVEAALAVTSFLLSKYWVFRD
jgi:putative flippase GtrA